MSRFSLWFAAGIPRWPPRRVGEPADGLDYGSDGIGEVVEVDSGEFVRRLVVVLVQAVAGDGLGDDSLAGEGEVVGALEEVLGGVRVGDEAGTVAGEFRAEVGAIEAGEPEHTRRDGRIGAADHLEFQGGDAGGERDGRMREEGGVAEAANLLRAEQREDD